jgi:hypothetical protein
MPVGETPGGAAATSMAANAEAMRRMSFILLVDD